MSEDIFDEDFHDPSTTPATASRYRMPSNAIPKLKLFLWQVLVFGIGIVIYVAISSEALRLLLPVMGRKVSQIAGLGFLANFQETASIDIAVFLGLALGLGVLVLVERLLAKILKKQPTEELTEAEQRKKTIEFALACVFIATDACLFCMGVSAVSWGAAAFTFKGFVATCGYIGILFFVAMVTIELRENLKKQEGDEQ